MAKTTSLTITLKGGMHVLLTDAHGNSIKVKIAASEVKKQIKVNFQIPETTRLLRKDDEENQAHKE